MENNLPEIVEKSYLLNQQVDDGGAGIVVICAAFTYERNQHPITMQLSGE